MSGPPPERRTRVYVACQNCRRRKIKCMTDDAEQKPCQRCLQKGLLCEYVPVSDGAQYAASSDNSGMHSSHTQPTNTASRSHSTTENYSATHGHSGYSQTMSHPSYHYQHGNRLINPGSSSYPVPRGQIYNPPVSPPTRPHYATPASAPHSVSPPAFSGNYGYPNQWPQSSPPSTQPHQCIYPGPCYCGRRG